MKINLTEKQIAEVFAIPLKTLRRHRRSGLFSKEVCFTYKDSPRILYNIDAFKKWLEEHKGEQIQTVNPGLRASKRRKR
jgi:hypothetical protein